MARARLPGTVIALGFTSFFTDVGSEMIFPLLPAFLLTLGAGPAFLGVLEGAADTVSSVLKLASGWISDRMRRRKPLVLAGYGLASAARPLVAIAAAPWHVLAVRLVDRVGKGLRSSPRDAIIADSAPGDAAGRAFGFQRGLDHAGAVTGPLVASALLALGLEVRSVFWIAAIPGLVAVLLVASIREPARHEPHEAPPVPIAGGPLPRELRQYLTIFLVFCLANSSDAFLLLRAHELGVADELIPLLWSTHHVAKVAGSFWGGGLADRWPRARVIVGGWVVYAASYAGLALATGPVATWIIFVIYGLYHGLAEPAEKALVRDLAPAHLRGRAYGAYNFVAGLSALPAGLFMGFAWRALGGPAALGLAAAASFLAAMMLLVWQQQRVRTAA